MYDINILTSNGIDVNSSLELFGTIDTYNDTVGEFLLSAKEKIVLLEDYKNRKDMSNYAIYAHSLKSDARYFGFTNLGEIAYQHELKSKEGDITFIINHFQELQNEVKKSISILEKYLNSTPGSSSAEVPIEQPISPVDETPISEEKIEEKTPVPVEASAIVYDKKTILVVDDSNIVRNFVKRIFADKYEIGTAKDGEEAINIISSNQDNENIIAILLDLNMPKKDGFEVLNYMNENNLLSKCPVSIISGDSSKDTIDKAFKYNIVDMISKPFSDASIKSVVEKTILFKEMNQ